MIPEQLCHGKTACLKIPKSFFQEQTDVKLEPGKIYAVRGRIDGVGEFRSHRRWIETEKKSVYINLGERYSTKLKAGQEYRIFIDSVEERRDFNVVKTPEGPTVKILRTMMESMGFQSIRKTAVIEFQMRNLSRPEQPVKRLFDTYRSGSEVTLRVSELGAVIGDTLRVEVAKQCGLNNFVSDFGNHRSESLRNVELLLQGKKLLMKVDGKEFVLNDTHLTARGMNVWLDARLESTKRRIKFVFDRKEVTARFIIRSPVRGMKVSKYGLEITYYHGARESTFRLYTERFDKSQIVGRVRLVSTPEREGEPYRYEVDSDLQEYVLTRLASVSHTGQWKFEKGDISEAMQSEMVTLTREWVILANHPHDNSWTTYECMKEGPDSVIRSQSSSKLSYLESKWHENQSYAYAQGRREILGFLSDYPDYLGRKVQGGYIGIMEWNVRWNREVSLYLEEV